MTSLKLLRLTAWFDGELSQPQAEELELQIEKDAELQALVAEWEAIRAGLRCLVEAKEPDDQERPARCCGDRISTVAPLRDSRWAERSR